MQQQIEVLLRKLYGKRSEKQKSVNGDISIDNKPIIPKNQNNNNDANVPARTPLPENVKREKILQRYGCSIARSTLCGWIEQVAFLLEPIVVKMQQELIRSNKLHTDDTPIPVLSKGKTTTGRFWVYIADGTSSKRCTIYDYSANRRQEIPQRFLSNYQGYLQADAYPGYNKLYESGAVIEVGCWAHARRKFFDIAVAVKDDDTIATDMLKLIQELYHTDNQGKHLNDTARYYYRKHYCKPILSKIHMWLKKHQYRQLPKTPIALAINYTVNL